MDSHKAGISSGMLELVVSLDSVFIKWYTK